MGFAGCEDLSKCQNVKSMGRESRIFGQKAFCSARGHSRVSGKRQSVSRRVFFPFFVFGNKMSSNSVFRMLEILFGERLGLGFKSCSICFPFVLRTSENRFQPNDFSIS